MSSSYRAEETPLYLDSNNSGYNDVEENFTDLKSCEHPDDADSQSSYSDSTDFHDEEDENRQAVIHFSKENVTEPNEDFDRSINKNKQKTTIDLSETTNDIRDLIREDLYKFVFMPISKQFNDYVRCRLIRSKSSSVETCRLEVEYDDDGNSLYILTAEKELHISGQTEYTISIVPKFTNEYYLIELETTNITGTNYSLYYFNGHKRRQLATVLYEINFFGIKGPRKIEALLPKFSDETQDSSDTNDIFDYYSKEQNNCFIHLHNNPPNWNPFTSSYSLPFNGKNRVTIASIKNFQMVIKNEKDVEEIVMQFGRMSENEFSCDFRYPLSLIQTFGIALSALESRLFRE